MRRSGVRSSFGPPPSLFGTAIKPLAPKPSLKELWSFYGADHGFVRAVYTNLHPIDGRMFRSSQPLPWQLRAWKQRYGLKTIINLRGERSPGMGIESRACARLGLTLHSPRLYSRSPPVAADLSALKQLFDTIEYPALLHCKSGADRAGMGAVLYRVLHLGHSVEDASRELHWRFGHMRGSHSGVLDFFLAQYVADTHNEPMGLIEWAETRYDPDQLKQRFRAGGWESLLADRVLKRE